MRLIRLWLAVLLFRLARWRRADQDAYSCPLGSGRAGFSLAPNWHPIGTGLPIMGRDEAAY
jgi:hypothetical protein